ncbi:MAG: Gfo/Idh/MocA family oxidoreductase [Acidaminobacter sp.]|uniref:Gfo/Idh/MocA family protein n=1 Tax=Acidaminobacter sp. TaxID=1872102 RepID=UPI00137C8B90|nr:Gfo/Idh/MocA family oxidoreductase [Acidaminobacter sp.]MZQ97448.1 Gfo/Idh/MocA family oxidoreductase [Acidaminobacter sp.]
MKNIDNKVKWGILGAAWIANERVIPAIQKAENAEVIAIASRSQEKADRMAKAHSIPKAYGSYETLLDDSEIDAVYIPLPNHLHLEWTQKAAAAGKHVLCEKPAALSEAEAHQMVEVSAKHNVLFMEAFAFRCHPKWQEIRELLNQGEIGSIQNVSARYSFQVLKEDDIRLNAAYGGGALYDIGCYCIQGIRLIMGGEPESVAAIPQMTPNGAVDQAMAVAMKFPGGRLATIDCTFAGSYNQSIEITGTEGLMRIEFPYQHPKVSLTKNGKISTSVFEYQTNAYAAQIEHFSECVLEGRPSAILPAEDAILNMRVIDKIYSAAGMR